MTYDNTGLFPIWGEISSYSTGSGYSKVLDPRESDFRNDIFRLERHNWIDRKTRMVAIETIVLNVNSMLFSFIQIVFEYTSIGGVFTRVRIESMRLYPYIDNFDFIVLGLQIVFTLVSMTRIFNITFQFWKEKKKCFKAVGMWIKVLSVLLCLISIVSYVIRIERTIYLVERMVNNPGTKSFIINEYKLALFLWGGDHP